MEWHEAPYVIGPSERRGLRRILINDGVDPEHVDRAVAVFASAPQEVWIYIALWIGARDVQALRTGGSRV